jgi:hypothetical protein
LLELPPELLRVRRSHPRAAKEQVGAARSRPEPGEQLEPMVIPEVGGGQILGLSAYGLLKRFDLRRDTSRRNLRVAGKYPEANDSDDRTQPRDTLPAHRY